jgi:hypothetical protein
MPRRTPKLVARMRERSNARAFERALRTGSPAARAELHAAVARQGAPYRLF